MKTKYLRKVSERLRNALKEFWRKLNSQQVDQALLEREKSRHMDFMHRGPWLF